MDMPGFSADFSLGPAKGNYRSNAVFGRSGTEVLPISVQALPTGLVSQRKPDGLILSTGNLYFTSHDGSTASIWRTAQSAGPGQEFLLYSEQNARFGDIVFAQVDGIFWGYFFSEQRDPFGIAIKRVPLTGGTATVLTTMNNVDVFNNHRNLVTDGVNLYWQDGESVRKMPIRGGETTVLDECRPNTPTAGIELSSGNIIYASVDDIRFVPTSGAITSPLVRTIAKASNRVSALHASSNGVYWGEDGGALRRKVGSTIRTISTDTAGIPSSISTQRFGFGTLVAWTQCSSTSCRLHLDLQLPFGLPDRKSTVDIADDALGVTVTPSRNIFWGDAAGVHRQAFLAV